MTPYRVFARISALVAALAVLESCTSPSAPTTVCGTASHATAATEAVPQTTITVTSPDNRATILTYDMPVPGAPPSAAQRADDLAEQRALRTRSSEPVQARIDYWRVNNTLRWNEIARALVARTSTTPPRAARAYALVSVAQHDALALAQHEPAISTELAVGAASAGVLRALFAQQRDVADQSLIEQTEMRVWGALNTRTEANRAITLGNAVATRVIARSSADGSDAHIQPAQATYAQHWQPNPNAAQPNGVEPGWGAVRPWLLTRSDALRPDPPPAFGSAAFIAALAEIRRFSQERTADQLRIAQYWADGPGSATPPGHWNQIACQLIVEARLDDAQATQLLARLNMALMDASIAVWDAKYQYRVIRPSQADQTITTPIGVPNFPAYPSGHSAFSSAAAQVLAARFPARAAWLRELADEASISRLYGGIHYRFDAEAGQALGTSIGQLAVTLWP